MAGSHTVPGDCRLAPTNCAINQTGSQEGVQRCMLVVKINHAQMNPLQGQVCRRLCSLKEINVMYMIMLFLMCVCFSIMQSESEMCYSQTGSTSGTLFLFPLDRTLIITENRKCGEGLPEGQQKNIVFSKRATFPHQRKRRKISINKLGLKYKKQERCTL